MSRMKFKLADYLSPDSSSARIHSGNSSSLPFTDDQTADAVRQIKLRNPTRKLEACLSKMFFSS